jgi:hypothetical protein
MGLIIYIYYINREEGAVIRDLIIYKYNIRF